MKPNPNQENKNKPNTTYCKIPYVKNLSEKLAKDLKSDLMTIAFKNENTIKNTFSKLKTKTPKDFESNVVYKIPCSQCNGVYIGQTGRYLKTRVSDHKRSISNLLTF